MQPPQGVHAKVVADDAEARAQQESGQHEPTFFEIHRVSSAVQKVASARPHQTCLWNRQVCPTDAYGESADASFMWL
jgi:hypothetical protein